MTSLDGLRVELFADGADIAGIAMLASDQRIRGFTTNPTLMRAAGVEDYEAFGRQVLSLVGQRPVSFEVFSDDFAEMSAQARLLASWGSNVVVKIPITNTRAEPSYELLARLALDGVPLNVTAVMTLDQVARAAAAVAAAPLAYISVFAGRIADTGRDPVPIMAEAVSVVRRYPAVRLLWASPREVLNVIQADAVGCDIITATQDILRKLEHLGKDLQEFSLETVQMFHDDARRAGYALDTAVSLPRGRLSAPG